MSFRISITDPLNDKITSLEVEQSLKIEDLKALIEVELNIPVARQILSFGGQIMNDNQTLEFYKILNDDLIVVNKKPKQPRTPLELEAIRFCKFHQSNPNQMQQLRQNHPMVAEAVDKKRLQPVMEYIQQLQQKNFQYQQEQARKLQQLQQLEQDPFNPENQKLIEEMINKKNIDENMQYAQEFVPESFGTVTMLYIELSINRHPVQAFVDSGAQSTIMSKACAERCGIMRLVDTRFAGIAQGVGTQKIIGKIHVVEMQILDKFLPCSLTILDGDGIDFLFGLDMLKRFQCCINLQENCLVFPTEKLSVSFLPEGQINKRISIQQEKEILERQNSSEQKIEQTQQQQQLPQQQQQQQIPNNIQQFPEEIIQSVMNVGANRNEAILALQQTNGNAELAAALIIQQKYELN